MLDENRGEDPIDWGSARRYEDLTPEERAEAGRAALERVEQWDLSAEIWTTTCLGVGGPLRRVIQVVADAIEIDQR